MKRRTFLAGILPTVLPASPAAKRAGVRRTVFLASPGKGTAVSAYAYYTKAHGGAMKSVEERWSRSDTIDVCFWRTSSDYGRTWSAPIEQQTGIKTPAGMRRLNSRLGWVDPSNGALLEFWVEGTLPNDNPLEGMRQWNVYYTISFDGGRTNSGTRQIIHKGAEYGPAHPLPGVYTGKNAVMLGDVVTRPLRRSDGVILLPVDIMPLGPDGKLYNPAGAYTYGEVAVLAARWKGKELEWEMGERIIPDPERTTRGLSESTIAALSPKKLMIVMRGSNDKRHELPSYRWVAYSEDGGRRWSKAEPWTYTDGSTFYSPSSCSQMVSHSSGRLFWLGNITPENPKGNRPRYPLVIGEVDRKKGKLIRDSVRIVDDRQPGEDPILTLSNFYAREDRQTHGIAVHMSRMFALPDGWMGDAYLYQIAI